MLVVNVAGWVVAGRLRSPEQAASLASAPVGSWVTAAVELRVLSQTVITRGDVRPEVTVSVGVPSSVQGAGVVTGLGPKTGDEVSEGERLVEVSGRPVILLKGDVPVYRSLKPLMSGADIAQLQLALARLGCDATPETGLFGELTKACVAKLYEDAGYDALRSSETEAADVTAAQAALDQAERDTAAAMSALDIKLRPPASEDIIAASVGLTAAQRGYDDAVAAESLANSDAEAAALTAKAVLDGLKASEPTDTAAVVEAQAAYNAAVRAVDRVSRVGESSVASASDSVVLAQAALDALRKAPDAGAEYASLLQASAARDAAKTALATLTASTGPVVPQGEVIFVPTIPARVSQAVSALGPVGVSTAVPGGPTTVDAGGLMTLTGGKLVVSATLRSGEVSLVRVGMAVKLLDELSNANYPATVTSVAAEQTVGADGPSGYALIITPIEALPNNLVGSNLRVTVTAASTDSATMVVPIAAVSSAADGTTFVSVVPDGAEVTTQPIQVVVQAGLSADGFVAIEPSPGQSLATGDRVVVGR